MTGKTHRIGGMLCCLVGYSVLESKGMLIPDVNNLGQLAVMYPFALFGSVVSDQDHHFESAPAKDLVGYGINKVLHLTTTLRKKKEKLKEERNIGSGKLNPVLSLFDAKHRSWQTHSDLFLALFIYLSWFVMFSASGGTTDSAILRLIVTGLTLGVLSHMILDLITPEGLWSFFKIALNKLFGLKLRNHISLVPNIKFFATSGPWEKLIQKLMWLTCFILIGRLLYMYCPYKIQFNF